MTTMNTLIARVIPIGGQFLTPFNYHACLLITSAGLDANSIKAVEAAIQNDNKCIQGSESGKGIGSVSDVSTW